jgi:hypothetical protein
MKNDTKETLKRYIPEVAVDDVYYWLENKKIHLKITRKRTTKLGDYRPPIGYPTHRISINHDLNPFAFLITFLHELAHLLVYEKHGRVKMPHGIEWKREYKNLLVHFINKGSFPDDISKALSKNIEKSKASSSADLELTRVLKKYDNNGNDNSDNAAIIFLEEIEEGEKFIYGRNRLFLKMEKRRTRYRCKELSTGRIFLFHPLAEVIHLKQ